MIGKDFQNTGKLRNITHRIGDGGGTPFLGPLKICSVRRSVLAILTKDQAIALRQLRGVTEHIYYPVTMKDVVLNRRSVRNLLRKQESVKLDEDQLTIENGEPNQLITVESGSDTARTDELGERIEAESEEEEESEDGDEYEENISAPFTFLDMLPLSICRLAGKNALVITDSRFCAHILDLDEHRIVHTFGKGGTGSGEFMLPSAVATMQIHTSDVVSDAPHVFYFVGDSQTTQKLRVFDDECTQIAEIGSMGPRHRQFNNIASVSCYDPFVTSTVTPHVHAYMHAYNNATTASDVSNALVAYNPTSSTDPNLPQWYRGDQSIQELEDMLYDDAFRGNFLIARDRPFVYTEDAYMEESTKSANFSLSKKQESAYIEKMYNILYITPAHKLGHIVVKECRAPLTGYYIHNNDPNRVVYECLYDLLYAQKSCKFSLGGDDRKYVQVAVCDQGNYRVQVFRFYWAQNVVYRPELRLLYVVGGRSKKYTELFDPTCAAYSPTGELAICDGGGYKVHVLSPTMQIIHRIPFPYTSPSDLTLSVKTEYLHKKSGDNKSNKHTTPSHTTTVATSNTTKADETTSEKVRSKVAGFYSLTERELHTTGIDYLEYLNSSLASYVTMNEREIKGEPAPTRKKKKFGKSGRSMTSSSGSMLGSTSGSLGSISGTIGASGSAKMISDAANAVKSGVRNSITTTNTLFNTNTNTNTNTSTLPDVTSTGMRIVKLGSLHTNAAFDNSSLALSASFSSSFSGGGMGLPVLGASSGALTVSSTSRPGTSALPTTAPDPSLVAAQRRRKANRTPCGVCYTAEGQLVVGYKSGGVLVYSAYEAYPMGVLEKLPITALERALQYLSYPDIEALRNCCLYLHNLTKDMRLAWRLFPAERTLIVTRVVSFFLEFAKLDAEGFEKPDFTLRDEHLAEVCPKFLRQECTDPFCKASHGPIAYQRGDIARQGAFLVYTDFVHAVSIIFDPKFLWKYELYIEGLYEAYGADQAVMVRKDGMSRQNETVRAKSLETVRVLRFQSYLEVMTLLEEQYSGKKDIHSHKLFHRMPRTHYVPKVEYALASIDRRMVIDPCEQYARPIDVPYKKTKGVKVITLKGMENVQRSRALPVDEHCAVFDCHAQKAADLINKLFS